ncbi:unnamed protein product [Phytomonas sp. EM1]|nr:unnamed protein product [Phytomonas sp. EM1]|eukprot:CCW62252.1 unnamed protein product [Phytomonas sp. isolate EM1]
MPSSETFVLLIPGVNALHSSGEGVMVCGERLAKYIMGRVNATLAPLEALKRGSEKSSTKKNIDETSSFEDRSTETVPTTHLHFSFVGHSMGGLIIRAALPLLISALREKYNCRFPSQAPEGDQPGEGEDSHEGGVEVHWETFCSIATPHAGVGEMPSSFKTWAMGLLTSVSASLRDMSLTSNILTDILLQDSYLDAWRAFKRRLLVAALNDQTVMAYSSIFCILSHDQVLLRARCRAGVKQGSSPPPPTPEEAANSPVLETVPLVSEREELPPVAIAASRLDKLSPERWPEDILPRERVIAERIIERAGPFEVCLVDFQTRLVKRFNGGHFWARLGARRFGHRAVICKSPWNNPKVFGFLSEYVVDVLVQAVDQTCPSVELAMAG